MTNFISFSGKTTSYSAEGADLIINSILRDVDQGFYLDIGANHPSRFSNTYKLYEQGWCGVAVDGNEIFSREWQELRPRDIFLTALVSDRKKEVEFIIFEENTLSSIDPSTQERYLSRMKKRGSSSHKSMKRFTTTTQDICNLHAPNKEINLLCVDVEGEDLNVLKGLDLEYTKPGLIVVEAKNCSLSSFKGNEIFLLLESHGYRLIAKTPLDSFFVFPNKPYLSWIPRTLL